MTNQVFDPARISKISKIMPQFSKVAAKDDHVLMGLEGDPAYPFSNTTRPTAIVQEVRHSHDGTTVDLKLSDGTIKSINEFTIAPSDVWEYSDKGFEKVMEREREMYRAETALSKDPERVEYRGVDDLREQVTMLRSELDAERQLTRNFHNTYIATLHELASDMCRMDAGGENAPFCHTFKTEFAKMQSRAEDNLYRGTNEKKAAVEDRAVVNEVSESDGDSLSDMEELAEREVGMSDYF